MAAFGMSDFGSFKLALLESIGNAKDVNTLLGALQKIQSQSGAPAVKIVAGDASAAPAGGNSSAAGNQPGDSRTLNNTPSKPSVMENLDKLRESFKKHGARGITSIGKKFKIIDDDNSGQVNFPEFKKCLGEHALGFEEADIRELFKYFDDDCSGEISFDEFLSGIRGEMNERRKKFVDMAFDILDKDKSGVLELCDLIGVYDPSKHPDVIAGKRSPSDVLREFLDTFDCGEKDGRVDKMEFHKYYSNVSASIDNDDYFELMMRNAWHISGGEGWCANTTNRRVLVTHADGRQSVEEIKNDIGISKDNTQAMQANLRNQGVNASKMEMHYANDDTKPGSGQRPSTARGGGGRSVHNQSSITFG